MSEHDHWFPILAVTACTRVGAPEEESMAPIEDVTTPKIARIWRGRTTREQADAYLRYWREEGGFYPLAAMALAVHMLREDRDDETEFITISWWPSIEAMSAFAGNDPTQIHHLPRDAEFLIELPESVQILEVVNATWFMPRTAD